MSIVHSPRLRRLRFTLFAPFCGASVRVEGPRGRSLPRMVDAGTRLPATSPSRRSNDVVRDSRAPVKVVRDEPVAFAGPARIVLPNCGS